MLAIITKIPIMTAYDIILLLLARDCSISSRGKVIDVLEKVIPKLVVTCLKTYDLAQKKTAGEYKASVDFKEYANPNYRYY